MTVPNLSAERRQPPALMKLVLIVIAAVMLTCILGNVALLLLGHGAQDKLWDISQMGMVALVALLAPSPVQRD